MKREAIDWEEIFANNILINDFSIYYIQKSSKLNNLERIHFLKWVKKCEQTLPEKPTDKLHR